MAKVAKNRPAMAKTAWAIGMSVSQAQGKIVRPTANMEIAEDHLEKI